MTRRFDREKKGARIAVEDFCQLSGLLTERKYKTSMEKAGKVILQYSDRPGLDAGTFFDLTLFSFLTGNADMHLKNFSLIRNPRPILAPAYDLLSTHLLPIDDTEEMALTVNGKKSKLKREDFELLAKSLEISPKACLNSFKRLEKALPEMHAWVEKSFLSTDLRARYTSLLALRATRLGLSV